MERPVGDKFKVGGCVLVVVADVPGTGVSSCNACVFSFEYCLRYMYFRGECAACARKDDRNVHFEYFGVNF